MGRGQGGAGRSRSQDGFTNTTSEFMNANHDYWESDLSRNELLAIQEWTRPPSEYDSGDPNYLRINTQLRDDFDPYSTDLEYMLGRNEVGEWIRQMDRAMGRGVGVLRRDTNLYRSITIRNDWAQGVASLPANATFTDYGFASTTIHADRLFFSGRANPDGRYSGETIRVTVKAPAGTRGLWVGTDLGEYTLARGTTFRIVKPARNGRMTVQVVAQQKPWDR